MPDARLAKDRFDADPSAVLHCEKNFDITRLVEVQTVANARKHIYLLHL